MGVKANDMTDSKTVNPGLTPKHTVELDAYEPMVRRIIAAHGRRVANADPEDLAGLQALHQAIEEALTVAIQGQRANGFSWTDIGRGLGSTRQNAQQRYGNQDRQGTDDEH